MAYRVLIDFSDRRDADLDADGLRISASMKDNPRFPTLTALVEEVVSASGAYHTAYIAARDGGRQTHLEKVDKRDALVFSLRALGANINLVAKGNKELLDSTGYPLNKANGSRRVKGPITLVAGRRSVAVTLKSQEGAGSYHLQYTQAPVTEASEWTTVYMITTSAIINGLEPEHKYAFRVAPVFHLEEPVYSNYVVSKFVE